jgi:hypothetical protein
VTHQARFTFCRATSRDLSVLIGDGRGDCNGSGAVDKEVWVKDTGCAESRKFWSAPRILASIACAPWAYFVWSGYDLCYGPRVHTVPNEEQVHLYVVEPLIGLLISIAIFIVANKLPTVASAVIFCFQLLALLFVVLPWTGGI